MSQQVPDGTFVRDVAGLVHPESRVHEVFRDKMVVIGKDTHFFPNPNLPEPVALSASTLTAVVDYVAAGLAREPVIVRVCSPTRVVVEAPDVGEQRQQFIYLQSEPNLPLIGLGQMMPMLNFHIQLMTCFAPSPARDALRDFCGPLQAGQLVQLNDNGVMQEMVTSKGVTRQAPAEAVQPFWSLAPYRTFAEIEQPESLFLLRLEGKKDGDGLVPMVALHEADGGAWRARAVCAIGDWLRGELPEGTVVIA